MKKDVLRKQEIKHEFMERKCCMPTICKNVTCDYLQTETYTYI